MRPFFRYYGSKWTGARLYGPPRRDLVIEPFAGSACYSVWWEARNVRLYDLSADVVAAWDWLIHCSEEDVRRVPVKFRSQEEWRSLPDGPRQVVFWNVRLNARCGKSLPEWYLHYGRTGEKAGWLVRDKKEGNAKDHESSLWGPERRERLIRQKPLIAKWSIEQGSYADIPNEDAHWHIDPPYSGAPGREYPHSDIDYDHLSAWCRSRRGAVDVCENEGADWLPFHLLYSRPSRVKQTDNIAGQSREVVWRNGPVDLIDLAREEAA